MSNRKRGLTREQIEELLAESSDSDFSNPEFDDSDNQTDSESECSNSSEGTVDYSFYQPSADIFSWSSSASDRQRVAFTGQSGIQVDIDDDNSEDPLTFFSTVSDFGYFGHCCFGNQSPSCSTYSVADTDNTARMDRQLVRH